MLYFDNPTQVVYKFYGELDASRGIAIADQIIDVNSGELIDLAEVEILEILDSWSTLFFIEE